MKVLYMLFFMFTTAFFFACGNNHSFSGKTAGSCLPKPKDLEKGEYAQYLITTDKYLKKVSAKIDDITDDAYILIFLNSTHQCNKT